MGKIFLFSFLISQILSLQAIASVWDTQQKGANFFNKVEETDRIVAAKKAGIKIIRLAPNKWQTTSKDFLIGNADKYESIPAQDLKQVLQFLDEAQKNSLKVVLTTLSLPGSRWTQQNGNKFDKRLWQDFKYHEQSAKFWQDLASKLKDHPALAGYDLINEPAPEKASNFQDWYTQDYKAWYAKVKNTPADLNKFYELVISKIRIVDKKTPIIVESGFYATPWAFKYMKKFTDPNVIYSFHMYEPYAYTNFRQKNVYKYPGDIPIGEGEKPKVKHWDQRELEEFLGAITEWRKKNDIPANKIYAGEFGVARHHQGAKHYLEDLLFIFTKEQWHWSFYSFREDTWPGMDYELGSKPLNEKWWEDFEAGKNPPRPYETNEIFNVILNALKK